jgi:hypothetical protein
MSQTNPMTGGYRYFTILGGIFVGVLLISNIAAQKLFVLGPFTFTAGILLFPISYIFGDVLTEVYGYARSRQIIWTGLFCNVLMAATLWAVTKLPPAPGWGLQEEFTRVLGLVPRIVFASIIGYWAGEFSNSYVMAKLKVWMEGRALWVRTVSSTVVGEGVDTIIFISIAFVGVFPTGLLLNTILSGYLFKVLYEVVATPLTYVIVGFLKRAEGVDVYDRNTNFNPFLLRVDSAEDSRRQSVPETERVEAVAK